MGNVKQWIKRQTHWSFISYIVGVIGIIIMIDGLFLTPLIQTKYGLTNIGLETAMILLLFAMVTANNHQLKVISQYR